MAVLCLAGKYKALDKANSSCRKINILSREGLLIRVYMANVYVSY